jgi:hypothetical protein
MLLQYLLSKKYRDNYTNEVTQKFNEAEENLENIYQDENMENINDTSIK